MISATDHYTARVYRVVCLPGDGIGPEVLAEAKKVLQAVERLSSLTHAPDRKSVRFKIDDGWVGGAAFGRFGSHLPQQTLDLVARADAVLFGTVGGPPTELHDVKWIDAEKNTLLPLRQKLNLAINLRPAVTFQSMKSVSPLKPEHLGTGVDLLIVRELLGCVYFGEHTTQGQVAVDVMRYTKPQVRHALEFAFRVAEMQPLKARRKVTVVDKVNILECSRLWRTTALEVSEVYPDVELNFMCVGTAAQQLLLSPSQFSVIATANLFGSILSDIVTGLLGSPDLMPSVSFGNSVHLYRSAGTSAQDIAGTQRANPIAHILATAMMLRYSFGMDREAQAVQHAVEAVLDEGLRTPELCLDVGPSSSSSSSSLFVQNEVSVTTSAMGDAIVRKLHDILGPEGWSDGSQ